mgnify:CR=1 FL=1
MHAPHWGYIQVDTRTFWKVLGFLRKNKFESHIYFCEKRTYASYDPFFVKFPIDVKFITYNSFVKPFIYVEFITKFRCMLEQFHLNY